MGVATMSRGRCDRIARALHSYLASVKHQLVDRDAILQRMLERHASANPSVGVLLHAFHRDSEVRIMLRGLILKLRSYVSRCILLSARCHVIYSDKEIDDYLDRQ